MTRKVNARATAADILAEIPEEELREKYCLSSEELDSIRNSAEATDLLKRRAEAQPLPVVEKEEADTWTCPSCGKRHPSSWHECPECAARAEEPPPQPKGPEKPAPVQWHKANQWILRPVVLVSTGALAMLLVIAMIFSASSLTKLYQISDGADGTAAPQMSRLPREVEVAVLAYYGADKEEQSESQWKIHDVQVIDCHKAAKVIPETREKIDHIYCIVLKCMWLKSKGLIPLSGLKAGPLGMRIPLLKTAYNVKKKSAVVFVGQNGQIWVSPRNLRSEGCPEDWDQVCGGLPCGNDWEELNP